jgi:hypothetical protein
MLSEARVRDLKTLKCNSLWMNDVWGQVTWLMNKPSLPPSTG